MQPDEIVRKILEIRGIHGDEAVREFLSEKPKLTYDPLLLPGMEAAAVFLINALDEGKHICVYGDYDVDGICGTALLVRYLRQAAGPGSQVSYYIPLRIEEGYGLNNAALLAIKERGVDVVVTVDCGSISVDEAAYAKEIGLELLITDHHDPDPDRLSDCIHINPKVRSADGNSYPFEKLSGAGVAFKLCCELQNRLNGDGAKRAALHELIDLVCVATIADVMPLVDENRTFVKYGLSLIRKAARPAFAALLAVSGIEPSGATVRDIAFGIAPRINALGRLGDAAEGVEFFLHDDPAFLEPVAKQMDAKNSERRNLQEDCLEVCKAIFEADKDAEGNPKHLFLLLKPENAHEGVSGIVAGKMRELTGLPCAVLAPSAGVEEGNAGELGYLKGSARSAGRLNLIELLRKHSDLFERLGGHAAAAGFLIKKENENALREALSNDLRQMLANDPDLLSDATSAELEVAPSDVTLSLAEELAVLAPFGAGNPEPLLLMHVLAEEIEGIRRLGGKREHLRFTAAGIPCIYFGGGDMIFPESGKFDIIGSPGVNKWNNSCNIQFAVHHIDML